MLNKDHAICIRKAEYSETSQVVTFLMRVHGKVGAIAKGSKRQRSAFGGPIEVLAYGEAVILDRPNARLATLTEFQGRHDIIRGIGQSLLAYNAAMLAAELVDRFTKDRDPHPHLYDSMLGFLQDIAKGGQVIAGLIWFDLELLREVGIYPVLGSCVNCQRPFSQEWAVCFFSSAANGIICRDCEGVFPDRLQISPLFVKAMLDRDVLMSAAPGLHKDLLRLLLGHNTAVIGQRLRTEQQLLAAIACQDRYGR